MFLCSGATIMRLRKPRLAAWAFALAFILCLTAWHLFAQSKTEALAPQVQPEPEQQQGRVPGIAEQQAGPKQFVRYGPLKGLNAYANIESGIAYAIEAGKSRFGIDWHGTWLFKLDEKNRIHERFKIPRPELKCAPGLEEAIGIYGMAASPDGKRLIIFIGSIDTC
jgi:hypothetical protein